jgi:epoxyqueuosine reductase
MSFTNSLKEYALSIGFTMVGITTTDDFQDFEDEVRSRNGLFDPWKERFKMGAHPKKMYPFGKSIIVVAYDYAQIDYPKELTKMIGRAYLSRCYMPLENSISGARIRLFLEYLIKNDCNVVFDKNAIPIRSAGARAGIVNFGKNNFSYVDSVGSFVVLYGFIVDRELEYDTPTLENKCPKGCRKCIDACPTSALYESYKLDPSRCIAFNNFVRNEDKEGMLNTTVPLVLRECIGVHIYGCDVCQEVCPRNRHKVENTFPKDQYLELVKDKLNLSNILRMTDGYYAKWVYPIMYNYIKDKKLIQRNAAIAIGNTCDDKYISDLEWALSNTGITVRLHCVWALGRIGGTKAKCLLEKHISKESNEAVKREIFIALSNI